MSDRIPPTLVITLEEFVIANKEFVDLSECELFPWRAENCCRYKCNVRMWGLWLNCVTAIGSSVSQ